METFVKIGFGKNSLAAQKNLSCPKFGRGRGGGRWQPPSSPGPYAQGCYHLFLHANTL